MREKNSKIDAKRSYNQNDKNSMMQKLKINTNTKFAEKGKKICSKLTF
jgi:hypothetical protein